MLKFLRKYNKYILAFFGTILMIAWLAPQGIQQLGGDPRKATALTINGVKYTVQDEQRAAQELSAIARFYPPIMQALNIDARSPLHWLALKHEAKAAGLMGGKGDGQDLVHQLAPTFTQGNGLPEEQRAIAERVAEMAAGAGNLRVEDFYESLGAVRGLLRLKTLYTQLPRMSDRRALGVALARQSTVWVDFVTIPADRALEGIADPDPAAQEAFFQEHRGTRQGEGALGIGYTLAPRVKFEYMKVDRAAIESAMPVDPIAVNQTWRQSRQQYPGEFAEERAKVESDMKASRVGEVMSEIHSFVQASVMRATRTLEADGRYKIVPPDWKRPAWSEIAEGAAKHVQERLKLTIQPPTVYTVADKWMTARDLSQMPDLGAGAIQQGSLRTAFPALVLSTKGSGQEAGAMLPVQPGVPVAEAFVEDPAKNRYYVTVLDVRPSSPPDSIEEIRELVVKDYKRVRAFEALRTRQDEFKALAAEKGLDAVAALFKAVPPGNTGSDPLPLPISTRGQISRVAMISAPQDGQRTSLADQGVRDAIIAAAGSLDPTKPASEQPPVVAVAPVPKRLEVVVARVTASTPFTQDDFRHLSLGWYTSAAANEASKLAGGGAMMPTDPNSDPFSAPALLARLDIRRPDGQAVKSVDK